MKPLLYFLLIISSLMLLMLTINDDVKYKTVKSVTHSGVYFDSHSNNSALASIKEFSETVRSEAKDINISFKMKAYSIGQYNNVFQTAQLNSGIRMELASPSTAALVVGCGNENRCTGVIISNNFEINKWYMVTIDLDRRSHLRVSLNGDVVVNGKYPGLNYSLSEFAVGTGLSKTRPFDGVIEDFSVHYSLLAEYYNADLIIFILKDILFLLNIMILFYLLIHQRRLGKHGNK